MALIIEVVNGDGSLQSVSLHVKVRALEVLQAIARRNKISNADTASYALYSWTLAVTRERATGIERANIVTLDELGPDDRPLMVRSALHARQDEILDSASEANAPGTDTRLEFGFGFLHKDEVSRFRDEGPLIIFEAWQNNPRASRRRGNDGAGEGSGGSFSSTLSSAGTSASNPAASLMSPGAGSSQGSGFVANGKPRNEFLPINTIGRGDKHGYLFQRSAANPREWQRRWCVLRKDDLVHCLSNLDHSDAHVIKLLQTRVKAINPRELGGLKHCFEIDTPKDVVQFRSKTQDEAQAWIDAISRNISLAADNENFRLAERMIEDGQRAQCIRDEAILERAMGSLEGLLSTHAGADRLFRFAKRAALGARSQRNADLVAFSVDLDRAHAAFSAIPVDERDHAAMISPSHVLGIAPPLSRATARASARGLFSGASVTSSSGSSTTGPLRGSAAALSRKDWILQICNRFLGLFEEKKENGPTDSKLSSSEVSSINAVRTRAEDLRRVLADESSNTFSRDACIQLIEGARTVVLADMREKLYQEFLASPEYESVVATIPSRLRDR